jgi:hypothetical protein
MATLTNTHNGDNVIHTYNFWQIGFQSPVRAELPSDYASPNYASCYPEVIAWPYTSDDNGISFDYTNLLGVRTYAARQAIIPDGGGETPIWTPVPKTLPGAYTELRPDQSLPWPYASGDLSPTNNVTSFNLLTANGAFYPEASPSPWVPQGRNTTAEFYSLSLFGTWVFISATEWLSPITGQDKLGYRSGSFFRNGTNIPGFSVTLKIEFVPNGSSTPQVVQTLTIAGGGSSSTDYALTTMLAPNGVAGSFQARCTGAAADVVTFLNTPVQEFWLGYRTDIPLWFFAATGNLVAPGGVLT